MKKFLLVLVTGLFLCNGVYAKHNGSCETCDCKISHQIKQKGGFYDASVKPVSIAEVKKLPDDTYVTVIGYLTERVGDNEYNFTDGKKDITVKIGDKVWQGQQVTPKDKIIVSGKVDKGFTGLSIKVKRLKIVD